MKHGNDTCRKGRRYGSRCPMKVPSVRQCRTYRFASYCTGEKQGCAYSRPKCSQKRGDHYWPYQLGSSYSKENADHTMPLPGEEIMRPSSTYLKSWNQFVILQFWLNSEKDHAVPCRKSIVKRSVTTDWSDRLVADGMTCQ
jgi:hypothetical protein